MPRAYPIMEKNIERINVRKRQGFLEEVLTELILKECIGVSRHRRCEMAFRQRGQHEQGYKTEKQHTIGEKVLAVQGCCSINLKLEAIRHEGPCKPN